MELSAYKEKIKNKTEKITRWFDRDPEKIELRATRDWNMVLVLFIVINVAIVVANMTFFFFITRRELLPVSELSSDSVSRLDKEKVIKAAQIIENREKVFQDLVAFPPKVVDPSL
jgi:hypothetical protein